MTDREIARWQNYELLDSGDGEKLERFGSKILVRPDPLILWPKASPDLWSKADLKYSRRAVRPGTREGEWEGEDPDLTPWKITWENLTFIIKPTSFKHTGLFPEQSGNWDWIRKNIQPNQEVLNLFGYTGGATLAAISAGAKVTHVDSSKPVVTWTKENIELSGLPNDRCRLIVDDVIKFVRREITRGKKYQAIFLDPPAFGHGPAGEIWQFEKDLAELLASLTLLMDSSTGIIIVNAYSLGFPAIGLENLLQSYWPKATSLQSVELTLRETTARAFLLPTGVAVRAKW